MKQIMEQTKIEKPDNFKTDLTKMRYNRVAPIYDILQAGTEKKFIPWRQELWEKVKGDKILEVGVGTGKNIPFYPDNTDITSIDLSEKMIERAIKAAKEKSKKVNFIQADIQNLPFEDNTFDSVVSTFVFCSVPNPVLGLKEVKRVLKPGGKFLLLEHVLSEKPVLRLIMEIMNPLMSWLSGANMNRKTLENIKAAGFDNIKSEKLFLDVVLKIETVKYLEK